MLPQCHICWIYVLPQLQKKVEWGVVCGAGSGVGCGGGVMRDNKYCPTCMLDNMSNVTHWKHHSTFGLGMPLFPRGYIGRVVHLTRQHLYNSKYSDNIITYITVAAELGPLISRMTVFTTSVWQLQADRPYILTYAALQVNLC